MVLSSVCANKTTSSSCGAAAAAVDCVFCEEKEKMLTSLSTLTATARRDMSAK